ncbi:MAG TPA: DNA repair protein RadA [Caldisericia bacterium]|nr:DNA repair protein RadA [Caldisericia bacterium]HPF49066.1 DNA repair protein RadA [Caldisericia bacterium]HPI83070.1 DNA repair protein RadA [Caldisericia bacterium]HPQ92297.1 DNA repair protein RadA [Caldisericia bacterium]HRV74605.1 DNA repair protein RadA [Caldisericia bacterium]
MAKKPFYVCVECGYKSTGYLGKCPNCNSWNSFEQEIEISKSSSGSSKPVEVNEIQSTIETRIKLNVNELDRVFGGGIVKGSVILIGGEPGVGKSTLMLSVASAFANEGEKVVYVSGEESPNQVSMRANRIGSNNSGLKLAFETNLEAILEMTRDEKPTVLFVDSVQILSLEAGIPGSPNVVREATRRLVEVAKQSNMSVFLIGHVTKEGTIAGPKTLEHLVDVVCYLEGEKYSTLRIFRGVKNRFGTTNEVGIFEMTDKGLVEADRKTLIHEQKAPGVALTAVSMGNRPLAVEVQALLAPTYYPNPRRVVTGCSMSRSLMIIAVVEKRCRLPIGKMDVYVNLVGGLSSEEPSLDMSIALAVASSFYDKPVPEGVAFIGEIGLTGEIRHVPNIGARIKELSSMGANTIIVPKQECGDIKEVDVVKVTSLEEALHLVWPRQG